ncbi:AAA family ATPase [Aliivibrio finisterrensis]|uniref:AAA domain-containing protein n=1 Tax=Aliivibrio finisterrensis TaxID=511998 RepID=A0A6N6RW15_9GAMM|nr:AAA family ATPase [Aliivibrio finisterrensis]KAB2825914.1 AAA domain-containing protein [Aliivibrio finisterrensis]
MNENNALQQLWDEFLTTWPLERIETMSLSEYVSIQNKTTFTYWLETKTQPLANIKGSPSPKFGIYKRNSDPKERSGMTHGSEYSWWNKFGKTEQEAFESVRCEIIKIIKAAEIGDLKSIDDVTLAPVYKWKIAFMYQNQNSPTIVNIFAKDKLAELTELPQSSSYLDFYRTLIANYSSNEYLNIAEYGRKCWSLLDHEMVDSGDTSFMEEVVLSEEKNTMSPLNQILYGPPGTGKTYHTIEAAVKAAEPEYYASLNINIELGATVEQRKSLQDKYNDLSKDGRIRFVTFHQSYGYEEFVEGMKAITNEDNQIEYQVQSGVFKDICLDALASISHQPSTLKRDARIWKLSIDGVKQSKARDYCFANDLAAIGWGNAGDMSDEDRTTDQIEYFEQLGALAKSSVMEFSGRMAEGDIVVCVKGQWSIQAIGVVSGDYQYREQGIEGRSDFCHTMPVKWLAKDIDVNLYALNDNTRLTLKTCYELTRFNSTELYELLKGEGVSLNNNEQLNDQPQNYVLIIDEINRGNISKIFGELITLIEPSKRKGSDEFIELTLPQSKKPFSVPDNLHIIGTMNTADRSLAMMDTALRRRFDFIEMMPKPELLANTVVDDIDLEELLTVLNERIEILYDREHTLGHAFFMPVKKLVDANQQEKAFTALVSVFQNKIIPLLEEYFFEDWDKIRLVLADNQKEETLQFVSEKPLNNSKLSALFGNKHGLNQYGETQKQYILKKKSDSVWKDAQAYKEIYATSDKQGE